MITIYVFTKTALTPECKLIFAMFNQSKRLGERGIIQLLALMNIRKEEIFRICAVTTVLFSFAVIGLLLLYYLQNLLYSLGKSEFSNIDRTKTTVQTSSFIHRKMHFLLMSSGISLDGAIILLESKTAVCYLFCIKMRKSQNLLTLRFYLLVLL